jgi:hypothetical protein
VKKKHLKLQPHTIRILSAPQLLDVAGGKPSPTGNTRLDCPPPPEK